jgi:hypothetical protein
MKGRLHWSVRLNAGLELVGEFRQSAGRLVQSMCARLLVHGAGWEGSGGTIPLPVVARLPADDEGA